MSNTADVHSERERERERERFVKSIRVIYNMHFIFFEITQKYEEGGKA